MKRRVLVAVALAGVTAVSCASGEDETPPPVTEPAPAARPSQLSDRDLLRLYEAAGEIQATRVHHTPRPHPRGFHRHPGDPTDAELARLRWCESGRDDSAGVDSKERARGFFKFMRDTWVGVGGHGDPAAATYAEQKMRAILLYRREGWTPWLASSDCTGLR